MKTLPSPTYSIVLVLSVVILSGCSKFDKLMKNPDCDTKYEAANTYYEAEDYEKASLLYEKVRMCYRRDVERNQKMQYRYANAQYKLGNYIVAGYYYRTLYELYPRGPHAEEALYMHAYCLSTQSAPVELDQQPTRDAIQAFTLFINKYPRSKYIPECNEYLDKLNRKLALKDIRKAKLYYKIQDYRAAVWSLREVIERYPAAPEREELQYLLLESSFELAEQSVETRKPERYAECLELCDAFDSAYPGSEYAGKADKIRQRARTMYENVK